MFLKYINKILTIYLFKYNISKIQKLSRHIKTTSIFIYLGVNSKSTRKKKEKFEFTRCYILVELES